jgi:hypothetical protein
MHGYKTLVIVSGFDLDEEKMRKTVILATVLMLTAGMAQGGSIDALGTAFGTLSTAQTIGQGEGALGLGVGAADMNSFFGFFAYGMSATSEGRLKLGIADDDGVDAKMVFGLDFHLQMLDADATRQDPLDLSVGGFMEYVDFDGLSVFQVGADLIGSYPVNLSNNTTLTPYGRFNVRLERVKYDFVNNTTVPPTKESDSESELKFGLNLGACWDMSTNVGLYGEFQFDGNDGMFLGLRYRVL